ncbi:hypothetical protein T06_8440 [Trichinella sp. T6]|nr:hypothetical protein T06_8440 [Trichinella sp. T6]
MLKIFPSKTVLLFNVLRSLDHYHPQQQRKQKLPLHKGCKNLFMPTTPFADAVKIKIHLDRWQCH